MHCCVVMCVCFLVVKKRHESVSDSSEKGQIVLKICEFLSVLFLHFSACGFC